MEDQEARIMVGNLQERVWRLERMAKSRIRPKGARASNTTLDRLRSKNKLSLSVSGPYNLGIINQ